MKSEAEIVYIVALSVIVGAYGYFSYKINNPPQRQFTTICAKPAYPPPSERQPQDQD